MGGFEMVQTGPWADMSPCPSPTTTRTHTAAHLGPATREGTGAPPARSAGINGPRCCPRGSEGRARGGGRKRERAREREEHRKGGGGVGPLLPSPYAAGCLSESCVFS